MGQSMEKPLPPKRIAVEDRGEWSETLSDATERGDLNEVDGILHHEISFAVHDTRKAHLITEDVPRH